MKFITLIPLLLCLSSPAYSKNSPFDRNVENTTFLNPACPAPSPCPLCALTIQRSSIHSSVVSKTPTGSLHPLRSSFWTNPHAQEAGRIGPRGFRRFQAQRCQSKPE